MYNFHRDNYDVQGPVLTRIKQLPNTTLLISVLRRCIPCKITGNERNVGCPIIYVYGYYSLCYSIRRSPNTRMHSSRMRTGRSLTVCGSLLPRGVCCLLRGGVSTPGGVCSRGGVCSGGCLLWGDVCSGGRCLLWVGGCIPACTEAYTLPPCGQNILDTHLWKYYLGPTSLRPVITMPETNKPIRQFAKTRFELIASNVTFF